MYRHTTTASYKKFQRKPVHNSTESVHNDLNIWHLFIAFMVIHHKNCITQVCMLEWVSGGLTPCRQLRPSSRREHVSASNSHVMGGGPHDQTLEKLIKVCTAQLCTNICTNAARICMKAGPVPIYPSLKKKENKLSRYTSMEKFLQGMNYFCIHHHHGFLYYNTQYCVFSLLSHPEHTWDFSIISFGRSGRCVLQGKGCTMTYFLESKVGYKPSTVSVSEVQKSFFKAGPAWKAGPLWKAWPCVWCFAWYCTTIHQDTSGRGPNQRSISKHVGGPSSRRKILYCASGNPGSSGITCPSQRHTMHECDIYM